MESEDYVRELRRRIEENEKVIKRNEERIKELCKLTKEHYPYNEEILKELYTKKEPLSKG